MDRGSYVQPRDRLSPVQGKRGGTVSVDVLKQLIDQLESMVSDARHVPLSNSLVMVDQQGAVDLLDQIRMAIPQELSQAKRISAERDRVLSTAREQADKIVEKARIESAKMVEDTEVVRAGREQAEAIMLDVEEQCAQLRRNTYEYVIRAFDGLDDQFGRLLVEFRAGREYAERLLQGEEAPAGTGYEDEAEE